MALVMPEPRVIDELAAALTLASSASEAMVLVNDRAPAVPVLEYVLPPIETDEEPPLPELAAACMTLSSVAAGALPPLLVVRLPEASR